MVAKILLPEDEVVRLWVDERLTTRVIAMRYGCDCTVIQRCLRRNLGAEVVREITRNRDGSPRRRIPTDTEKAWAAGFFDGEGSINIEEPRKARGYSLKVSISQNDPRPLVKIAEIWGGSVKQRRGGLHSDWKLVSRSAGEFLMDISSFLVVKSEQATLAIEFQSLRVLSHKRTSAELDRDRNYKARLLSLR